MDVDEVKSTRKSPIIVLGMHRSGTSLLTRALMECGLYLGEEGDLVSPHEADNPEGYWEHKQVVSINDRILGIFGGTDQRPPNLVA